MEVLFKVQILSMWNFLKNFINEGSYLLLIDYLVREIKMPAFLHSIQSFDCLIIFRSLVWIWGLLGFHRERMCVEIDAWALDPDLLMICASGSSCTAIIIAWLLLKPRHCLLMIRDPIKLFKVFNLRHYNGLTPTLDSFCCGFLSSFEWDVQENHLYIFRRYQAIVVKVIST